MQHFNDLRNVIIKEVSASHNCQGATEYQKILFKKLKKKWARKKILETRIGMMNGYAIRILQYSTEYWIISSQTKKKQEM